MGKTIGIAKEQDELYCLLHKVSKCHKVSLESWNSFQIWLQHKRLRHPPFRMLRSFFPHLFNKVPAELFHRDVCEFAKSHRGNLFPE